MKNYPIPLLFALFAVWISACDSNLGAGEIPNPDPTPIAAPGKASLTLPEHNQTCETGEVNGTTASVTFTWTSGEHSETFDLSITNTDTNQTTSRTNLSTATATVPLSRGHQYTWTVSSKNKGTQITTSDTYSFYLAGDGEENAAPFPAEAIAPEPGSSVTASAANKVRLEWEAADPDNDTLSYTLLIDTIDGKQSPVEENIGLSTTTKEITVTSGVIYYWSVITSDGTISVHSDVFSFKVD